MFYDKAGLPTELHEQMSCGIRGYVHHMLQDIEVSPQDLGCAGFVLMDAIAETIHELKVKERLNSNE